MRSSSSATQKQWLTPEALTRNAAFSACEKGVRPESAFELFGHAAQTLELSEARQKQMPSLRTQELSEARQKQGPMPNAITHNASISAFEKGERPEQGA